MPGVVHAQLEKLVATLGLPAALKLAERFPGVRVYVPHPSRLNAEHAIAQAIGLAAARQLAQEWPALEILVPRCAEFLRRERDRALRADRAELSAKQAALKYEINERQVFRIWAAEDEPNESSRAASNTSQGSLF